MDDKQLGQILLKFNLITEPQLQHCLKTLERLDPPTTLGKHLIRRGLIDEKTLAGVARMHVESMDADVAEAQSSQQDLVTRLENADVYEYLRVARELGASDLYLTSNEMPLIRLHGSLTDVRPDPISHETCRELMFSLLTEAQRATFEEQKYLDLSIETPNAGRFRANIFQHFDGIGGVFRVIAEKVWPFEDLKLPQIVEEFVDFTQGLVLVTGPTGSGKTTTLASLIDIINERYSLHVISLEDPIEVIHESKTSLITQREVFTHTDSFDTGLRAALREDPDIIVVGEMRDPTTVATALTAAETGHLVFGTLHTKDAYSTILRIIDQFPVHKRAHVRTILAGVLRAVVCQQLLPNLQGDGLVLASEVMVVNPAISNLIREDRPWQIPMVMQMNTSHGMQIMDDVLENLVRRKKVALEAARAVAADRTRFAVQT